jgi:5-(carboxyamino)imidazole ribonucleotide synthase
VRIGILGGGQLGRMLALAAHPLGHEVITWSRADDEPAAAVSKMVLGEFEDEAALAAFVAQVDVVTYEFENVPAATVEAVARHCPVRPGVKSLRIAGDRVSEKNLFRALGIGTAPFAAVEDLASLERAVAEVGLPAVLKTRRFGYDGKGQFVLRDPGQLASAWEALGGVPCILEGFMPFTRELSIIGVRSVSGEVRTYPLVQNEHERGILRVTHAPAPEVSESMRQMAREAMEATLIELDHVGVLTMELFDVKGVLFANEIAPRVHNTGHFTIEGATTSQFENHIRAVVGAPLGDTSLRGVSWMRNLIGSIPSEHAVLATPGAHLHLYGKSERRARKVGHITVSGTSLEAIQPSIETLSRLVNDDG